MPPPVLLHPVRPQRGPLRALCLIGGCHALWLQACAPAPEPDQLTPITLHQWAGCPVSADATLDLTALGDFAPGVESTESLPVEADGRELGLPIDTQALEASASSPSGAWLGLSPIDRTRADIVLWDARATCELARAGGFPLPSSSMGVHPGANQLLVVGGFVAGPDAARAMIINLSNGEAHEIPSGILPARADARVTAFGDDMLVSGGVDPRERGDEQFDLATPLGSAIQYRAATDSFDTNSEIAISPRSAHAAVVLRSGETLLIGGRSPQSPALASLEAVSPETRSARIAGLTQLVQRRSAPQAFVLDDGRVFVGGGVDASKQPVQSVEWLNVDASQHVASAQLQVSPNARFAALPGSSVLAVGVCSLDSQCSAEELERGVVWLAGQRAVPLRPLPAALEQPTLISAARGAAWLISGSGPARSSFRFSAWDARFVASTFDPSALPPPSAIAVDAGAIAWPALGQVLGQRADRRGRFARDVGPLLLGQPGLATPVTPSEPPSLEDADARVSFTASGLGLADGGSVWLSDTSYAGFELTLRHSAGPRPQIILLTETAPAGASYVAGAGACPWPAADSDQLSLVRSGDELQLRVGEETVTCDVAALAAERVRLGISAPSVGGGATRVRSFEIVRRR